MRRKTDTSDIMIDIVKIGAIIIIGFVIIRLIFQAVG